MPVFQSYSPRYAGSANNGRAGIIQNAKPHVYVYPWRPQQQVRKGAIRPELAGPELRTLSFAAPTVSGSNGAAMASARQTRGGSSTGAGCSGRCGGCSGCGAK